MRTRPPRQTAGGKRSSNHVLGPSELPTPKTRRLQKDSRSPFSSNSYGVSDKSGKAVQDAIDTVVKRKIILDNLKTVDVDGFHDSSVSHVQYREDRQYSPPKVFTMKWYESLQGESIDKKRFMIPQNVLMPDYFAIEDHFHNSLFSSGAEMEEASLLYQVLAFVQNISNELLCVMKSPEETVAKAREKSMLHIWKKVRGISEMLETRYDLLQFRKRGHSVQAKLLESYCVPQIGGSILAKTVFRKLRNVCNGENAVISAEYARTEATRIAIPKPHGVPGDRGDDDRNALSSSKQQTQLGEDGSGYGTEVLHIQKKAGRNRRTSKSNIANGIDNALIEISDKDCSPGHAEVCKRSRYKEIQIQPNLSNVHDELTKVPVETTPLRPLAMAPGSRVMVERIQNDGREGEVVVPRQSEWPRVKVTLRDGKEQTGSDLTKSLPCLPPTTRQTNPLKKLSVEPGHDQVRTKKNPALPLWKEPNVLLNAPNGVEIQRVNTLLTRGNTIAFTYVLGEEQLRFKRYLVVCPSWGGFSWALLIFPNGDRKPKVLAVFLKCFGREGGEQNVQWKANAKFGICVAKRTSPIYASALDGGQDETVANNACNEVLKMLPSEDGRIPRRLDVPYFGRAQHVFQGTCNNRGFPQLVPSSELRSPMFSNDEKKIVLLAYISEVQDVGQK
ncbi:TRAF-like protein [Gracilaria domingensis]|nr:TRAF-like protein [Gracilaria domingensis]